MFELRISPKARRDIKKLKIEYQDAILEALSEIREEPLIVGKSLSKEFTGRFTYRVGAYRIIYKVREKDKIVHVLSAKHRSIVYQ